MNKKQKKVLKRIIVAAVLLVIIGIAGSVVSIPKWLEFLFYLVPYFVIGYDILRKAWKGICNRQMFDENFLMAVATIGAIALGDYKEGVAVMLFYQIGELFQSYAVGKSRRNISDLMDIRPDYANIETDGQMEKVDPDEVEIGTVIIVQPGEKVPIDGVVVEGHSSLNTSALTGESVPREVAVGEEIISGCINISGLLKIRTTKEFGESTVSKILDLVENASSKKSRSENFISRFAHYYTPAVCYGALYAYRDRKNKKRQFRSLWIQRINAAVRGQGMTYSEFMGKMNAKGIRLNRKVLADLAMNNAAAFEKIVKTVK